MNLIGHSGSVSWIVFVNGRERCYLRVRDGNNTTSKADRLHNLNFIIKWEYLYLSIASRLFGRQFLKHDHVLSLRVCFIYVLSRDEVYLVVPGCLRLSCV